MRMIKCKVTAVTDGDFQKLLNAIGRPNEEIVNRSYFQHVGLTSIPPAGSVGILIVDGDNVTMIASADPLADRPELSNEKDVALYADENKYVKINADGEIVVKNNNNTITLKANGDIEIGGSGLKKLITEDILTPMSTHIHAGVTAGGGVTGAPTYTPVLSTALHATQKTEAQ